MFGVEGAERQIEAATDFTRPLQDMVTRYCFGETWGNATLDRKTRSMLTLALLTALGKQNQLRVHVKRRHPEWRQQGRDPRSAHAQHDLRGRAGSRRQLRHHDGSPQADGARVARASIGKNNEEGMRVGFVGIGNMGSPMAGHIVKGGHTVTVVRLGRGKGISPLRARTAAVGRSTLADLGDSEVVITMLPDGHAVRG